MGVTFLLSKLLLYSGVFLCWAFLVAHGSVLIISDLVDTSQVVFLDTALTEFMSLLGFPKTYPIESAFPCNLNISL
jgi:hypothetical protein